MLENTHAQASRAIYAETQRALTKRTLIADPETIGQCIEEAERETKESYWNPWGGGSDILILGLWEYARQWVERLLGRIPGDAGLTYQILENHGLETYALAKVKGTAPLEKNA